MRHEHEASERQDNVTKEPLLIYGATARALMPSGSPGPSAGRSAGEGTATGPPGRSLDSPMSERPRTQTRVAPGSAARRVGAGNLTRRGRAVPTAALNLVRGDAVTAVSSQRPPHWSTRLRRPLPPTARPRPRLGSRAWEHAPPGRRWGDARTSATAAGGPG